MDGKTRDAIEKMMARWTPSPHDFLACELYGCIKALLADSERAERYRAALEEISVLQFKISLAGSPVPILTAALIADAALQEPTP